MIQVPGPPGSTGRADRLATQMDDSRVWAAAQPTTHGRHPAPLEPGRREDFDADEWHQWEAMALTAAQQAATVNDSAVAWATVAEQPPGSMPWYHLRLCSVCSVRCFLLCLCLTRVSRDKWHCAAGI